MDPVVSPGFILTSRYRDTVTLAGVPDGPTMDPHTFAAAGCGKDSDWITMAPLYPLVLVFGLHTMVLTDPSSHSALHNAWKRYDVSLACSAQFVNKPWSWCCHRPRSRWLCSCPQGGASSLGEEQTGRLQALWGIRGSRLGPRGQGEGA